MENFPYLFGFIIQGILGGKGGSLEGNRSLGGRGGSFKYYRYLELIIIVINNVLSLISNNYFCSFFLFSLDMKLALMILLILLIFLF